MRHTHERDDYCFVDWVKGQLKITERNKEKVLGVRKQHNIASDWKCTIESILGHKFAILHKNVQWKTWRLEIWCKFPNRCHWAQVQLHGINFGTWVFFEYGFLDIPTSGHIPNCHYYMYSAQRENTSSFGANATWCTCVDAHHMTRKRNRSICSFIQAP